MTPREEAALLGDILGGRQQFSEVALRYSVTHFTATHHRAIFQRMLDLFCREETIDRVAVANELMKSGQLESCGGLSYLIELDGGNCDGTVETEEETAQDSLKWRIRERLRHRPADDDDALIYEALLVLLERPG